MPKSGSKKSTSKVGGKKNRNENKNKSNTDDDEPQTVINYTVGKARSCGLTDYLPVPTLQLDPDLESDVASSDEGVCMASVAIPKLTDSDEYYPMTDSDEEDETVEVVNLAGYLIGNKPQPKKGSKPPRPSRSSRKRKN